MADIEKINDLVAQREFKEAKELIESEKLVGEFKFNNSKKEGETTSTLESALYLKDGAHYLSNKKTKNGTDVSTSKIKYESTLSYEGAMVKLLGLTNLLLIPAESSLSLSNVLVLFSSAEGIKFYMDTTDSEVTKIKISIYFETFFIKNHGTYFHHITPFCNICSKNLQD